MKKKDKKVEISCSGCGRTQTLRAKKVQKADYYFCGCWSCKKTGFKAPDLTEEGLFQSLIYNAAGGFQGIKYFKPTEKDLIKFQKAKRILRAGLES